MTLNDVNDIWQNLEPIQNKAGTLILISFKLTNKKRLRRREIASILGVKKSRAEGGMLSDKTLDKNLKKLISKNILTEEIIYDDYPPGKYFNLTSKGENILNLFNRLIDDLKE